MIVRDFAGVAGDFAGVAGEIAGLIGILQTLFFSGFDNILFCHRKHVTYPNLSFCSTAFFGLEPVDARSHQRANALIKSHTSHEVSFVIYVYVQQICELM